jgi:hypothetical protein
MAQSQFQKMILIPENATAQMVSSIKSSESIQSQLDHEMNDILSRNDLTVSDKYKLYQQALHRYLQHTPQANKPIALPLIEPEGSKSPMIEFILESVPKTLVRKTSTLLNLMHVSNRISWDSTGVVSIDSNLIPGSNIIDLVHDVVRKRTTSKNPIGIQQFKQFLQEINIPKELINFQFGAGNLLNNKVVNTIAKKIVMPKKFRNKFHKKSKRVVSNKVRKTKPTNFFKNYKEYSI